MKPLKESIMNIDQNIDVANKGLNDYITFCNKSKELYDEFWKEFEKKSPKLGLTKHNFQTAKVVERVRDQHGHHVIYRTVLGTYDSKTQEPISLLFKKISKDLYNRIFGKDGQIIDWDDELIFHDGNPDRKERYRFGHIYFEERDTLRIRFRYFLP